MLSAVLGYMRYRETKKARLAADAALVAARATASARYIVLPDMPPPVPRAVLRELEPHGVTLRVPRRWYHTDYPVLWQVALVLPLAGACVGQYAVALLLAALAALYLLPVGRVLFRLVCIGILGYWTLRALGAFGHALFDPMVRS